MTSNISGIYEPVFALSDFSASGLKRHRSEAKKWNRIVFGKWKGGSSGGAFIPNNDAQAVTHSNVNSKALYSGDDGRTVSGYYWKLLIDPLSDPKQEA